MLGPRPWRVAWLHRRSSQQSSTDLAALSAKFATALLLAPSPAIIDAVNVFGSPLKKALLIGIRYTSTRTGRQRLSLPHSDMELLAKVLESLGFYVVLMLDDPKYPRHLQPTRANILTQIAVLMSGTKSDDRLFFAYSGHADQEATNDVEEEDGFNECLVPIDCKHSGLITDNTLHELLVRPLRDGVSLFAVFDCCNSGTILDLHHNWGWKDGAIYGPHTFPVTEGSCSLAYRDEAHGRVVCFSAAADGKSAWEFRRSRISFLRTFTGILRKNPDVSLGFAFELIRDRMNQALAYSERDQEPEFSSNDSHLDYSNTLLSSFL